MSNKQARMDINVNIFDLRDQHAKVLPNTTPNELIESILEEFREIEYLGMPANTYFIQNIADQKRLDPNVPLDQQVNPRQPVKLVLIENRPDIPENAIKPKQQVYLREAPRDRVYKLSWFPAIIGRPSSDPSNTDNKLVAVDLSSHDNGLRVSRRQARISEENGALYIENLGSNPTILATKSAKLMLDERKQQLHHGDVILLERSGIQLKVIVRGEK